MTPDPRETQKAVTDRIAEILNRLASALNPVSDVDEWAAQQREHLLREDLPWILERVAALQRFKDYVHKRLDDAGIPVDPDSPHKAEGCRIGGRLDYAFAENARLRERPAWQPFLSDRADGVKGHYAIGRRRADGIFEYWNLRSHEWAACSDDVLTLEEANRFLAAIEIPTRLAPASAATGEAPAVTPGGEGDGGMMPVAYVVRTASGRYCKPQLERLDAENQAMLYSGATIIPLIPSPHPNQEAKS